jgi:hypothetical protein
LGTLTESAYKRNLYWEREEGVAATAALEECKKCFCDLLRDIFGNPFRFPRIDAAVLGWNGGTLVKLAQTIYGDRAFDRLPILADALEEAGCDNANILNHCRSEGPHVRGCWVLDAILVKT